MIDQFEFATGVVEDNNDPLNKARVRVRIDGYHTLSDETTGDTFGLVVEDLDWYPVLMPTTSSSRGGQGYSPSNLTRGDRVALLILDVEYKQSAIVIGTIHGDGDTSDLVIGGIDGMDSDVVKETNNQRVSAPKLNSQMYDKDAMENDDVGYDMFFQSLIIEEGFVDKVYYDQFKYPHIGIGTLLIKERNYPLNKSWKYVEKRIGRTLFSKRITLKDAELLATKDINRMRSEIFKYPLLATAYTSVSSTRQYALLSMCYQMGTHGVSKFTSSLNKIISQDWNGAYNSLTNSAWARQTPARAKRVASVIRDNNFNVYPTLVNKSSPKPLMMSARTNIADNLLSGVGDIADDIMGGVEDMVDGAIKGVEDIMEYLTTPEELPPVLAYGDLTDLQVELMEATKIVQAFTNIQTLGDILRAIKIIINFDKYVKRLYELMEGITEKIKKVKDIDVVDFIQKYLDRFKKYMEEQFERLKQFIMNSIDKAIQDIKGIIKLVELIIKRVFNNISKISKKIDESVDKIYNYLFEEKPPEEETDVSFTEPPSEYAGQYPYVKTEISESGHIREVDDTPGFERIREQHRTGTYREINSNGRLVEKTVSDRYLIVKKDEHIYIEGNGEITIGGNHTINIIGDIIQTVNGNVKQTIRGDSNVDIAGDSNITVHGNTDLEVKGNVNELIHGNVKTEIRGNVDLLVKGNVVSLIEGDVTETVNGNVVSLIKGNLNSTIEGTADLRITGNTEIAMYADANMWIEGNSTSYVGGDSTISVRGDLTTTVEGDWNNDVSGNLKFRVAGNIELYGNKIMLDRS